MERMLAIGLFVLLAMPFPGTAIAHADSELDRQFQTPPDSSKPWVYWFWLNGNITREGITADLEAMHRVGIGGVLIMEVDQGTPVGPVDFMSQRWRELFKHVTTEAQRLGLEVNLNNDAGWNGSGGPWIKPEQSMQKVVWSEMEVEGPRQLDAELPQPEVVAGFYRDIAVLAFPMPEPYRIDRIEYKAGYRVGDAGPASQASLPPEIVIARDRITDISSRMDKDGRLGWDVPSGKWTIIRFGHTSTGVQNAPAPESGRGLECDKLSKEGIEANFAGMMAKLIADVGPAAGKSLVATHIDSWENGAQNWTARMREEFRERRGYDLLPFLPAMTGRVVGSLEISERFLWDLRQTISDLVVENYAGHMRILAHQHGLRLSIEAYGGPCDEIPYGGRADEPMCEFWIGGGAMQTCKEMASSAHVYGKPILGAEAFTAGDQEKWLEHPATIKALGDQAFCDGVNRFVFHRYAMQPWLGRNPGMTMGPWGIHYERTQTWWDWSGAWHEYLARCQFLLRQGRFVADICYLQPEAAPQGFAGHARQLYDYDNCTAEAVLTRMTVKDGRIVLPDGMSYRLLVLPKTKTMTPRLLRKIKELVEAGATVTGPRPLRSPGLSDYPKCDEQVRKIADELWGKDKPSAEITEHSRRKGRVFWGSRVEGKPDSPEDAKNPLDGAKWIWHQEGNPAAGAPVGMRYFRRTVTVEVGRSIESAKLSMTADNSFQAWVNGQQVGTGDNFGLAYIMDVTSLLKPGVNIMTVAAGNGGVGLNPAGLIGLLTIRFSDGGTLQWCTDRKWETTATLQDDWTSTSAPNQEWGVAMELGNLGMSPWGSPELPPREAFPHASVVPEVLARMDLPPDFEASGSIRYIHRRAEDTDIFFVANSEQTSTGVNCTFRVSGKLPEIWDPLTGRISRQAIYRERDGRTTLPLWFEPSGSLFVVFREPSTPAAATNAGPIVAVRRDGQSVLPEPGRPLTVSPPIEMLGGGHGVMNVLAWQSGRYEFETASGQIRRVSVPPLPPSSEVSGPWEVRFPAEQGVPERVTLQDLISWSQHKEPGVKYFSGTATYIKTLSIPPGLLTKDRRLYLDMGKVQVMAGVTLNGKLVGTLWKPPFHLDITDMAKPGDNALEVKVVNLWPNRMIGDEQLPEDSRRNDNGTLREWPQWLQEGKPSATGRHTFTSWRLWKKDAPLLESGLLGPVTLQAVAVVELKH